MAHEFESGFMVREKAWHGLGTIVQEAPTSADALHLAGLDWDVKSMPVIVADKEVEHYKANVRSSDNAVLGIVKDRYQIVQNKQAFEFTDALLGEGVKYETAGSLRGGKTVWLLAKMDNIYVLGDEIEPYMCFTNAHDGSSAVRVCMTDVRVVCNNTLSLALSTAPRMWAVRHTANIMNKTHDAARAFKLASEYNKELNNFAEAMVKKPLMESEKKLIVNELFKTTEDMSKRQIDTMNEQKTAFYICTFAPDLANFENTRWQLIQAATDFVSHKVPTRATQNYQENNWQSLIFGNAFLDKAMDLVQNV